MQRGLSFDPKVIMRISNIKININIDLFDDRERINKLRKYLESYHGSNVSIKELINQDLLSDANKQLLNNLKAYKRHQMHSRLYIHGYIIKRVNTRRGDIIIILIRFKDLDTNKTFTLYPDILLPMIKFTVDDIDRYISKFQYKDFYRFDIEGLQQLVLRINTPTVYKHCCNSLRDFLQIVRNLFNEKIGFVHKLYPRYCCAFHTSN